MMELEMFARMMAAKDYPLLRGLQIMELSCDPDHKAMFSSLEYDIEGGESLHVAMQKLPSAFPAHYVNLVQAVEAKFSGKAREPGKAGEDAQRQYQTAMGAVFKLIAEDMRFEVLRIEEPIVTA
jgi:hypothetical protein